MWENVGFPAAVALAAIVEVYCGRNEVDAAEESSCSLISARVPLIRCRSERLNFLVLVPKWSRIEVYLFVFTARCIRFGSWIRLLENFLHSISDSSYMTRFEDSEESASEPK